jgi:hypothetical protein
LGHYLILVDTLTILHIIAGFPINVNWRPTCYAL